jgi:hypothetical protein
MMDIANDKPLRKPFTLYLVAAGYLVAMVLYIVQVYQQTTPTYMFQILFIALFPVAAYGIFRVRRWGWYLVVSHMLFLLIANVVLAIKLGELDNQLFIQLNLLLVFLLWYFLRSSVRSPFHNPALRWWERQHSRYGATFEVTLRKGSDPALSVDGINLSSGGCFVRLADDQNVALHDRVEVELKYDEFEPFHASGRVTWVAGGSEFNPKGAGIAFSRPDRANRLLLKAIMRVVQDRGVKTSESTAPA